MDRATSRIGVGPTPMKIHDANYETIDMEMSEDSDAETSVPARGGEARESAADPTPVAASGSSGDDDCIKERKTSDSRPRSSRESDRKSDVKPSRGDKSSRRSRSRERRRSRSKERHRSRSRSKDRDRHRPVQGRRRSRSPNYRKRSPSPDRHERGSGRRGGREWGYRQRSRSRSRSRGREWKGKGGDSGLDIPQLTPQELVRAQMAAQVAQVKQMTGIELPKYYNPIAMNPLKFAEQERKKKLLWGNKEKKETSGSSTSTTIWNNTAFTHDNDGMMTAKFKRLMGIKGEEGPGESTSSSEKNLVHQQEEMFSQMERQYEVARVTTHTQRGVGLGFGFSTMQPAQPHPTQLPGNKQ